jgi:hypothetical protein
MADELELLENPELLLEEPRLFGIRSLSGTDLAR